MKDTQYKIRECLIETVAKLGAHYGLDVFKANFEGIFFNFVTDTVHSVRETGVNSIEVKF